MNKTLLSAAFLFVLLISTVGMGQVVDVAEANPISGYFRFFDNLVITVQSPQNMTYNMQTLPLNFTIETNDIEPHTRYFLNDEKPVFVQTPVVSQEILTGWYGDEVNNHTLNLPRYTVQGSALLSNLTDGTYNLTIQRFYYNHMDPSGIRLLGSATSIFVIDTTPPSTHVIQPANSTYDTPNVPLKVLTTEPAILRYNVDGQANVTTYGNTTLTGLTEGSHTLTVYANDAAGNEANPETTTFTVETQPSPSPIQQQTSEPSPTLSPAETEKAAKAGYSGLGSDTIITTIALLALATAVGMGVAIKNRKRR